MIGDKADQRERADDLVEQPFHHDVPVRDRPVEHVEHRHVADIGIGARPEPQLVGVRGQPDVDRQHPKLLEHLQDAAFRRDRQREDHEIDPGLAGELDEVVDGAELGHAVADRRAAVVAAIVEHADDAHIGIALRGKRLQINASPLSPAPTTTVRRSRRPWRVQRRTSRNKARRKAISVNSPST